MRAVRDGARRPEKHSGHIIECLLTELGLAGRENIWHSVMAHGPRCARSVRHDLGPNIFPSGPPTQSISTYSLPCLINLAFSHLLLNDPCKYEQLVASALEAD